MATDFKNLIEEFPKQLLWKAELKGGTLSAKGKKIVVGGMGGSALAARLLGVISPESDIRVHSSYDLPELSKDSLHIAISYSGDTRETNSFAKEALELEQELVVIASGGKLLSFAKENSLPFIQLPEGLPPRMAVGFMLKSLAHILGGGLEERLGEVSRSLDQDELEEKGKEVAEFIGKDMPLIYVASSFAPVGYLWKTNFNETPKVLSFWNVVPESNHNELEALLDDEGHAGDFCTLLLHPHNVKPEIKKRIEVMAGIFEEKGIKSITIEFKGKDSAEQVVKGVVLSIWASFYLAEVRDVDPLDVSNIEEFKKKME